VDPATTADVEVPGLVIVEDAVSSEEEEELLQLFDGSGGDTSGGWETTPRDGRRVRHYG